MNEIKHKLEWCLEKAKREIEEGKKHRGLLKIFPNKEKAQAHIKKAEHYLDASIYLKKGNYSDISASTLFYCSYHCMLALAVEFGYESRNQDCTFALINSLIEDKKVNMEKSIINKISIISQFQIDEKTALDVRERYQYGTELALDNSLFEEIFNLAKDVLEQTKEIINKK
jgi:uncharacterized protein (UPF0332 family)